MFRIEKFIRDLGIEGDTVKCEAFGLMMGEAFIQGFTTGTEFEKLDPGEAITKQVQWMMEDVGE